MKVEQKNWYPISEIPPAGNLMVTYGGPYSEQLLLNIGAVQRFLDVASLDGGYAHRRLLIEESTIQGPRKILDGINPDGSVTARRSLTWEERREVDERRVNPYLQVEPDASGWVISINGSLIRKDLADGGLVFREAARPFSRRFNDLVHEGLQKAVLKDKCTFQSDPFLGGRIIYSGAYLWVLLNFNPALLLFPLGSGMANTGGREGGQDMIHTLSKFGVINPFDKFFRLWYPTRRTVRSRFEIIDFPFELDRIIVSLGYLQFLKRTGQPLVKLI